MDLPHGKPCLRVRTGSQQRRDGRYYAVVRVQLYDADGYLESDQEFADATGYPDEAQAVEHARSVALPRMRDLMAANPDVVVRGMPGT